MKIIYQYEDANYGLVVIEQEPQRRTIWLDSPRQLNFPYVLMTNLMAGSLMAASTKPAS